MSASLDGSSHSSNSRRRDTDVTYRVVAISDMPDRRGHARLTLEADEPGPGLTLDLPRAIATEERLAIGDVVEMRGRVYGWAFARAGATEAFFLVLTDAWSDQLVARPVRS